ncbi:MAG: hypothetical protein SFV17_00155 [Candidatus Obscuribacter sp.]|nr:hypothetical protein [Candidatus Obscuribacter sp.]
MIRPFLSEANCFIVYEPFFRGIPLNSPLLVETPFSTVNLQLDIDCDIHTDLCAAKQEIEEVLTAELANSGITVTSEPQKHKLTFKCTPHKPHLWKLVLWKEEEILDRKNHSNPILSRKLAVEHLCSNYKEKDEFLPKIRELAGLLPNFYHELKDGKPKVLEDSLATATPNVRVTFDGYTISRFSKDKRKVASSVEITSGQHLTGLSLASIDKTIRETLADQGIETTNSTSAIKNLKMPTYRFKLTVSKQEGSENGAMHLFIEVQSPYLERAREGIKSLWKINQDGSGYIVYNGQGVLSCLREFIANMPNPFEDRTVRRTIEIPKDYQPIQLERELIHQRNAEHGSFEDLVQPVTAGESGAKQDKLGPAIKRPPFDPDLFEVEPTMPNKDFKLLEPYRYEQKKR